MAKFQLGDVSRVKNKLAVELHAKTAKPNDAEPVVRVECNDDERVV